MVASGQLRVSPARSGRYAPGLLCARILNMSDNDNLYFGLDHFDPQSKDPINDLL